MSETKFTPGPWRLDEVAARTGYLVKANHHKKHGGGPSIVTTRPALRTADAYEEARANARLIAAAPDLYAALEHILAGSLSLPRFAEEQARAALTKARGEQ